MRYLINKASFWRLLLFILLPLNGWGQWSAGTTWHYTFSEEYLPDRFRPLLYQSSSLEVRKDTLINNEIWQILTVSKGDECNPLKNSFLARNSDRKIKVRQNETDELTWYDFNLEAGDSLMLPVIGFEPAQMTLKVLAKDSAFILNKWRTIQEVEVKVPPFFDQAGRFFSEYPVNRHYLIEDIGSTVNFFMFWEGLCHGKRIYNLRCFTEEGMTYHHEGFENCDSSFFWQINALDFRSEKIGIYPNPAANRVSIQATIKVDQMKLLDCVGRLIGVFDTDEKNSLYLPQVLKNGVYFCHFYHNGKSIGQTKLVIHR